MRALVTGLSGFSGSRLRTLLESSGVTTYSLAPHPIEASDFPVSDIDAVEEMTEAFRRLEPDYVFHLAGIVRGGSPTDCYRVNTEFAVCLLHALSVAGLNDRPVLLVGTAAEYGLVEESELPLLETHPCRPVSPYGISKLAQSLAGLATADNGQPVVIARPFNIIGPGVPQHLVLGSAIEQLKSTANGTGNGRVQLGDLSSSRDLVDVDDAVRCYWDLIRSEAAYGQIVNICTGRARVLREVIDMVIELSGLDVELDTAPEGGNRPVLPVHYGCPNKLRGLIGWTPSTALETTLRGALEYVGISA